MGRCVSVSRVRSRAATQGVVRTRRSLTPAGRRGSYVGEG